MIEVSQLLNPELYLALQRRFEVKITNQGVPLDARITPDASRPGGYSVEIARFGEAYRICCPKCGDRRFRLHVNHSYGMRDLATGVRFGKYMLHCFNEGCDLPDFDDYLKVYLNKDIPVVAQSSGPVEIRPADAPGKCSTLGALKQDGVVRTYLKRRNFDIEELERDFLVGYCYEADERWPVMNGRIVAPVYYYDTMVGWQGRTIDPGIEPKYYTMPGFPKSQVLYNYDRARRKPLVIVCEGVTDVWRVGECGVCVFGHEISGIQSRLIHYTWSGGAVVILLDSRDPVAQGNARDWVEMARKTGAFLGGAANVVLPNHDDPADMTRNELWAEIYKQCTEQQVSIPMR